MVIDTYLFIIDHMIDSSIALYLKSNSFEYLSTNLLLWALCTMLVIFIARCIKMLVVCALLPYNGVTACCLSLLLHVQMSLSFPMEESKFVKVQYSKTVHSLYVSNILLQGLKCVLKRWNSTLSQSWQRELVSSYYILVYYLYLFYLVCALFSYSGHVTSLIM